MNLADITTKCYILALIIRDDGERLLLGDGAYEFKDSQQHFIANTYANDVVELQGTDGQMLAGQVRRTATQTFAGYIGDATFSKQKIETARRNFLMFFRKKHYYTAVYVFSDGTAIQRKRGYIVNAPSAPELYQRYPEWSIGLNFEDPNYYEYAEDDLGQEIAAHKVELELSTAMSGGLIWDGDGAVSDDLSYVGTEIQGEGKNFQLANTGTATLKSAELLGDAEQDGTPTPDAPQAVNTVTGEQTVKIEGKNLCAPTNIKNGCFVDYSQLLNENYTETYNTKYRVIRFESFPAGTYTFSINWNATARILRIGADGQLIAVGRDTNTYTFTTTTTGLFGLTFRNTSATNFSDDDFTIQLEKGNSASQYEPYQGQTLPVNLGKNLLPISQSSSTATVASISATSNDDGTITLNGTGNANGWLEFVYAFQNGTTQQTTPTIKLDASATYTLSSTVLSGTITGTPFIAIQKDATSSTTTANVGASVSFTGSDGIYRGFIRVASGQVFINAKIGIQVEAGTSASSFAPYFTPIKLAGVGEIQPDGLPKYRDSFKKNLTTGKWYIEKQIGKVDISKSTGWSYNGAGNFYALNFSTNEGIAVQEALSNIFTYSSTPWAGNGKFGITSSGDLWIMTGDSSVTSITALITWLENKNATVYGVLAAPTTTEITNSELVGQLERLQHAHTYADLTNFSVTATSPNLPAYLKVIAFGDDAIPQGGYVWEDGGTGGATTITVEGVDNAQPIWTVVGPATNPSLTNITTGESIQWTGVVPNGQTLVVNMADMTASLSGANVFEFISGSWITLQAGNNRVSYSATAATGIATLEWNGVVG